MEELIFHDCALKDKTIFFFDGINGLPGKMDIMTGRVTMIENMVNYKLDYFECMICTDEVIIACSISGNKLLICDLNTFTCECVDIGCNIKPWDNFISIISVGAEIFIFPRNKREVLIYNIKERHLKQVLYDTSISMTFSFGCKIDETMWLFPENGQEYVAFSLVNKKFKKYSLQIRLQDCIHCAYKKNYVYILNRQGQIYELDLLNNHINILLQASEEKILPEVFSRLVYADKKLILLPSLGMQIKIIDIEKESIEIYSDYPEDFQYSQRKWSKYYGFCEDEENTYFAMRSANYILKVEKETGNISWLKPVMQNEMSIVKLMMKYSKGTICEGQICMEEYLNYSDSLNRNFGKTDAIVGKNIWNSLKKEELLES